MHVPYYTKIKSKRKFEIRNINLSKISLPTVHTYTHTYIHTYIHVHTNIQTYIHICVPIGAEEEGT